MTTLVVATGNPGKLREMQAYLTGLDLELMLKPVDLDIEETGTTFLENARLKASQVAIAMNQWAIADDSGLMVNALDGAPGIYSARYAPTPKQCIERVLAELGDAGDRRAQFVCAVAIARPNGSVVLETKGICQGEILHHPRGGGGFGYDPIFYVPGPAMTFAEMDDATKNKISHRGQAFHTLLPKLQGMLPLR